MNVEKGSKNVVIMCGIALLLVLIGSSLFLLFGLGCSNNSNDTKVASIFTNPSQPEGYIVGGRGEIYELVPETLPVYDETFDRDEVIYAYRNRDDNSPFHQLDIVYSPKTNSYSMYFDNEGNRELFAEFEDNLDDSISSTVIDFPNAILQSKLMVDEDGSFFAYSEYNGRESTSSHHPVVSYLYGRENDNTPLYEDFIFTIVGNISDSWTITINELSYISEDTNENGEPLYSLSLTEPMSFDYIGRFDPK